MHVVFIASRSLDAIGGIENYMKNLCPRLVARGIEITLYSEGKSFRKGTYQGVRLITIPSIRSKFLNKIVIALFSTIHAMFTLPQHSIFHYNAVPAAFFSFIPLMFGKKVIYQGHGFEWKRAKWSPLMRRIIKHIDGFVVRINENITMVSEEQAAFVRQEFAKSAITITPGVNFPKEQVESNFLERFSIRPTEYFLYLGRLVEEKKADVMIQGFRKCPDSNVQLVIAGDDPSAHFFKKRLHNLANGDDRVIFTGAVYGNDKEKLLQDCMAFCIPSELEGLPITLLEAMSYGKVCMASDINANIEALGDTGLFFGVNDTEHLAEMLCYVAARREQLKSLGEQARQRIKDNFTWDMIVDSYLNFCMSLTN